MIIPIEDAPRAGISLDHFRVDEKDGGPGYPATVESLHQLHCLVRLLTPNWHLLAQINNSKPTIESPPTRPLL